MIHILIGQEVLWADTERGQVTLLVPIWFLSSTSPVDTRHPTYMQRMHTNNSVCMYVCRYVLYVYYIRLHVHVHVRYTAASFQSIHIHTKKYWYTVRNTYKLIRYIVLLVIPIRALSRECTSETTRGAAVSTSSTIIRFRHFENGFESSYHIITAVTHDCFPYKQASSDRKTKALMP